MKAAAPSAEQREAYLAKLSAEGRWPEYVAALRGSLNGDYNELPDAEHDTEIMEMWSGRGKLHVMRWLREGRANDPCPWGTVGHGVCDVAAGSGYLDCLAYAHESGCEWDGWTCHDAARGGHLDCLQYARAHGCAWRGDTCRVAVRHGRRNILEWLNGLTAADVPGACGCPCGKGPHALPDPPPA